MPTPARLRAASTALTAGGRAALATLALAAMLGACTGRPAVQSAVPVRALSVESYEFANMRPSNIVPKSSASALVGAFRKYCLTGPRDPQQVAARLRAADYIAAPAVASRVMAFVVDDSRPMVMISRDGRSCAVGAEARSGQSARIRAMIASQFAGATPLDPARINPRTELAVETADRGAVIFVQRLAPFVSQSRLILGIWHQEKV